MDSEEEVKEKKKKNCWSCEHSVALERSIHYHTLFT
jgi:hypothetical protein